MFVVYSRVSDADIRNSENGLVKQTKEFFDKNPKRRTAKVEVWYGRVVTFTRKNYEADIKQAIADAIAANNK